MTHSKPIIAIDGPAASGKGTLARRLAAHFGCAYLDTGALYRAVGYKVLQSGADPEDKQAAEQAATKIKAEDLENPALRTDEVGNAASKVAAHTSVRETLLAFQKNFARAPGEGFKGAVLDGRDIGTVICPDADIKLFITASTQTRAKRRAKELQSKGIAVTYEAVLKDMRERDGRDSQRESAPMRPADDATVIDTGALGPDEVFDKSCSLITRALSNVRPA